MLGKTEGRRRRGATEDEMVGWQHGLNGHEFEQALGVGAGQRGLVCCGSWGYKESDTTEQVNNNFSHYKNFPWDTRTTSMDVGGQALPEGPVWGPQGLRDLGTFSTSPTTPTWTPGSTLTRAGHPARGKGAEASSRHFSSLEGKFSISHKPRKRAEQVKPWTRGRLPAGGVASIAENLSSTIFFMGNYVEVGIEAWT